MKKMLLLCFAIVSFCFPALSQNNQIKLYIQQIAANKVYLEYLQKGYKIARQGLTFIGNVKDGHFKIDKDFFLSLESINPRIRNYSRIAEIVNYGLAISSDFKIVLRAMRESQVFAGSELDYVGGVRTTLLTSCENILMDLVPLITPGQMELSDDERIKRIDALHAGMEDCYLFTKNFCTSTKVQVLQRQRELRDVQVMKKVTDKK